PSAEVRTATPGLLAALGTPVLRGRGVEIRDRAGAPPVVLVNQALADRHFPGEDPVGRRLRIQDEPREIVGVVADVRQFALDRPAEPVLYLPLAQAPRWLTSNAYLVLRAAGDPAALARGARATVRGVDPRIPVSEVRTMERVIGENVAEPRFRTTLLVAFGALALALAAIGIYGVIAYGVAERRRELAVRVAVGATRRGVLATVLGDGMRPVLLGLAFGLLGALAAGRLLASLLFGVSPADPITLLAVAALTAGAGALANYVPARRASRVDPMIALRAE
ncbi:MAG: FtsX-like permease family protein, partial [Gemmatimonadota bacterium]